MQSRRKPLASLVAWRRAPLSRGYYGEIGGKSPLLDQTIAQARELERELARRGIQSRCAPAMRYWHPFSHEAVALMRGVERAHWVAVPLYPHRCKATSGSSYAALDLAMTPEERESLARVGSYAEEPGYLDAMARTVREALSRAPGAHVLFSAHSVPASFSASGDPYEAETRATYAGLVARLPEGTKTGLSWQSKVGPVKWLEPFTERELARLAKEGVKRVVVVPISFVSDHIETVQEIDIRYRALARALGFERFERARALNEDPMFIAVLATLVERAVEERAWDVRTAGASSSAPGA